MSVRKQKLRKNAYKSPVKNRRKNAKRQTIDLMPFFKASGAFAGLAVLAAVLILGYSLVTQVRTFAAKRIAVTGCERLSQAQVLETAGIKKGDNIFALNLSVSRQRLLAHPWISKAEVIREMPDGVLVRITEHKPMAIVDMGKRYLMDTEGRIFKHLSGETDVLPVITGFSPEDIHVAGRQSMKSETNPHKAVMNIIKLAQEPGSGLPYKQIKEILVDREIGLTLLASGPYNKIRLGYGDYQEKIRRLTEVTHYLQKRAGLDSMDSIDLDHINRIVVKPLAEEAQV